MWFHCSLHLTVLFLSAASVYYPHSMSKCTYRNIRLCHFLLLTQSSIIVHLGAFTHCWIKMFYDSALNQVLMREGKRPFAASYGRSWHWSSLSFHKQNSHRLQKEICTCRQRRTLESRSTHADLKIIFISYEVSQTQRHKKFWQSSQLGWEFLMWRARSIA